MLPPCLVMRQGTAGACRVHVPHGDTVEVHLELETGETLRDLRQLEHWAEPRSIDGMPVGEAHFELPEDLPLGYHTLSARSGANEASSTVAVTPAFLGLPEGLGAHRTWGFATQLYSVRSSRSWGVGDLTDLTDLAVWSGAELGAGFALVNPLHAAEPVAPMEPSPYLPSSRRFFNPLYLRLERIPEYVDLASGDRVRAEQLLERLRARVSGLDAIDRDSSWTAKRRALELMHRVSRSAGREEDYRAFVSREGEGLRDFATWCALAEEHGSDARAWPEALRDPASLAVGDFRDRHAATVDFHMWLQWLLDEQLQTTQAKAVGAGMAIGVMHDLAVGVHAGGADAWRLAHAYAQGVQVGAPPDDFNQLGQDWSQPPWRPDRLAELAYAPFRELVAGMLRHAGGVRVDHVIGLFRLWWVPAGRPPSEGTYVRYDHEALVGILALEAHRAGAMVVGEDLGVVEPSAREYLRSRGILGTSILWFEWEDQAPQPPARRPGAAPAARPSRFRRGCSRRGSPATVPGPSTWARWPTATWCAAT